MISEVTSLRLAQFVICRFGYFSHSQKMQIPYETDCKTSVPPPAILRMNTQHCDNPLRALLEISPRSDLQKSYKNSQQRKRKERNRIHSFELFSKFHICNQRSLLLYIRFTKKTDFARFLKRSMMLLMHDYMGSSNRSSRHFKKFIVKAMHIYNRNRVFPFTEDPGVKKLFLRVSFGISSRFHTVNVSHYPRLRELKIIQENDGKNKPRKGKAHEKPSYPTNFKSRLCVFTGKIKFCYL